MKKGQTNMRLSEEARKIIEKLAKKLGIGRAAIVEMAVRKFERAEEKK